MEAKKKTSNRFSPEVRERAVRMVLEHQGDHASQWAAIASIAAKIERRLDSVSEGRWVIGFAPRSFLF